MKYVGNKVEGLKIAYIGGGSRQWARVLMRDLALTDDLSGEVRLYDIDYDAALLNEKIGNAVSTYEDAKSDWKWKAYRTLEEALAGADFVFISIIPGTFDEMESDVHTPEKYGIYQSVGDTTGPGGIVRALRAIPMIEKIALAVKEHCPDAWVINYSNPMSIFTRTLYAVWPKIKAFGCCHEVFAVQKLLARALKECRGIEGVDRTEIKTHVMGINHFTWFTEAKYRDIDLFEVWEEFLTKYEKDGVTDGRDDNWINRHFECAHKVKFDLYKKFGYIGAAGDRHLAEFCPLDWYLASPEHVYSWKFSLTPVSWRRKTLLEANGETVKLANGDSKLKLTHSGEEEIDQMRALLGLRDLVTNVNLPNCGQISNLPLGVCVETNACFTTDAVSPVLSGDLPAPLYPMIARVAGVQETVVKAGLARDLELGFAAFLSDPLVRLSTHDARKLYDEMINNTKHYLTEYFK